MVASRIRLTAEAETDLAQIYRFVRRRSGSTRIARAYIARIRAFLQAFDPFPQRGSMRDTIRPGLRVIGFERRVSVAFIVEAQGTVVLRILYAGRQFDDESV
jgi:toxin ParE1/3/4